MVSASGPCSCEEAIALRAEVAELRQDLNDARDQLERYAEEVRQAAAAGYCANPAHTAPPASSVPHRDCLEAAAKMATACGERITDGKAGISADRDGGAYYVAAFLRAEAKNHGTAPPASGAQPSSLGLRWQCSGCRFVFAGPWQQECPSCGRLDYWTGSVDPAGVPWPGAALTRKDG